MHETLTTAGNFYTIFPWNIQNLNNVAAIFQILQNFSMQHVITTKHISIFFIVIIYSLHGFPIVPTERFHTQEMFSIR